MPCWQPQMDCCYKQACSKRQLKGLGIAAALVSAHISNFTELATLLYKIILSVGSLSGNVIGVRLSHFCPSSLLKLTFTDQAQHWKQLWQLWGCFKVRPCVSFWWCFLLNVIQHYVAMRQPHRGPAWELWLHGHGQSFRERATPVWVFVHSWPTPLVLVWLMLSWQLQGCNS